MPNRLKLLPDNEPGDKDSYEEFDDMSVGRQHALLTWIRECVVPQKNINRKSCSYSLKHDLEYVTGLYVTNGEFRGAMLYMQYAPANPHERFWNWRIKLTAAAKAAVKKARAGGEFA